MVDLMDATSFSSFLLAVFWTEIYLWRAAILIYFTLPFWFYGFDFVERRLNRCSFCIPPTVSLRARVLCGILSPLLVLGRTDFALGAPLALGVYASAVKTIVFSPSLPSTTPAIPLTSSSIFFNLGSFCFRKCFECKSSCRFHFGLVFVLTYLVECNLSFSG